MKNALFRWINTNRTILANAGSLMSTTAVTSGLGFVYWWLAARQFPPTAVGLAAAAVSAMMLLGNISVLGLGTLLLGELSRQPNKVPSLITTALLVAGISGGITGTLFALGAPQLSAELQSLATGLGAFIFAGGVSLTAGTLVLDHALTGLLRSDLQLWRNALFAVIKLALLWAASVWMASRLGLTIYATWAVGNLISIVFIALLALYKGFSISQFRPEASLLRQLRKSALGHHALNLTLQGPGMILPILVTVMISTTANAHFYAAWMIATLVFVAPVSLTTVLYTVSAAEPEVVVDKIRHTFELSLLLGLVANVALFVGANRVLSLFGPAYAEQARWSLHLLTLAVFPLTVRHHYVAIARIYDRLTETARFMLGVGVFELVLAAVGAGIAGLTGLSLGWLVAVCIEVIFMIPTVRRAGVAAPDRQTKRGVVERMLSVPIVDGADR